MKGVPTMSNRRSLLILFSIIALSFLLLTSYIGNNEPGASVIDQNRSAFIGNGSMSMLAPAEHILHAAVSLTQREYERLSEWVDRYEERHPNIRVVVDNVPESEAFRRFSQAAELGGNYDIVLLDNDWTYRFATSGWLAPLPDGLITDLDNRLPDSLKPQVQWNGLTWAVPMDLNPYVLVYNPAALAPYGLDEESAFQEIVDFHFAHRPDRSGANDPAAENAESTANESSPNTPEAAETNDDDAPAGEGESDESSGSASEAGEAAADESAQPEHAIEFGLTFDIRDPYAAAALLSAVGALVPDESGTGLRLSSDDALDIAVRLFEDLARAAAGSGANHDDADWKMLAEGKAAMRITALSEYAKYGSELEVRLLPGMTDEAPPSLWTRGRSWAVFAKSPDADAAFRWIEAITDDQVQLSWAEAAGRLPASETGLLSAAAWPAELTQPWFRGARTFPASPDYMDKLMRYRMAVLSLGTGEADAGQFRTTIPRIWTPASSPSS
jgi:ABC-type glycerol-3-phosphate transport system substrate-binding protein